MAKEEITGLEVGLEDMLGGIDELGGIDSSFGTPDAAQQKQNMFMMDRPIPGQSLTAPPGQRAWETPPEHSDPKEAVHSIYMNSMQPEFARDLLRLIDAGVPLATLVNPVVMHGVSEGKWSMDTAMLIVEPIMVIWAGMAEQAGIAPVFETPKKKKIGVDPRPIKAMFSKAKADSVIPVPEEMPDMNEEAGEGSLLGKRRM